MRTIPDDILLKLGAMRPQLIPLIDTLIAQPNRAMALERTIAYEFLGGDVGGPLTAQEVYWLAASSAGHPYGRYIDLDYAAHTSGLSTAHLRRLLIDGKLAGVKWRGGEWYADRVALDQLPRSNAGRPKKEQP